MALGFCACLSAKFMKPLTTIPVVLLSLLTGLALLVMALVVLTGFGDDSGSRDLLCESLFGDIAKTYKMAVDHYTCSASCPCP